MSDKYYIKSINSSIAYRFASACHKTGIGYKQAQFNYGIFRSIDTRLIGVCQLGCIRNNRISLSRFCFIEGNREEFLALLKQKFPNNEISLTASCEDNIAAPIVAEYHDDNQQLFSRRALIRRGELVPDKHYYGIYNSNGKLECIVNTIAACKKMGYTPESVTNAIATGKIYKNKFFRSFINEMPTSMITVPFLCRIGDKLFFKLEEVGKYLGVSKQAVSAAHKRDATEIKGQQIIWG